MNGEYKDMTVNERLYVAGLIDRFYDSVDRKDVDEAIKILRKVDLTDSSITPILKQLKLIQ